MEKYKHEYDYERTDFVSIGTLGDVDIFPCWSDWFSPFVYIMLNGLGSFAGIYWIEERCKMLIRAIARWTSVIYVIMVKVMKVFQFTTDIPFGPTSLSTTYCPLFMRKLMNRKK